MKIVDKNAFSKGIVITILLSIAGFILLSSHLVPYGYTLFCVMPVITGYIIGQVPSFKITLFFGGILGLIMFLFLLIIGGLEGIGCVLLLSPFLFLLFFVGMGIGFLIRSWVEKNKKNNSGGSQLKIYLYPLVLLFLSGFIENFFTEKYTDVRVETKIILPYPKEVVFDYVKSFDTLDSEKPFLLKVGMPVPVKCVLEKDAVGAKRTCYFKEGTIDEIVTDFRRGEALKMKITSYNMPGRWLHFEEAVYLLTETGGSTELTRITTYKTELKPRFYWDFWERKSVSAEHDYVFTDLKRRLDNAFR